jgi:hypothetical protein
LVAEEQSSTLIQEYFKFALSNAVLFEAIVALSQIHLTSRQWASRENAITGPKFDPDALYHYGKALVRLRALVSEKTNAADDVVLFSIATLMGFDVC